jgi:hypothetical protein
MLKSRDIITFKIPYLSVVDWECHKRNRASYHRRIDEQRAKMKTAYKHAEFYERLAKGYEAELAAYVAAFELPHQIVDEHEFRVGQTLLQEVS